MRLKYTGGSKPALGEMRARPDNLFFGSTQ